MSKWVSDQKLTFILGKRWAGESNLTDPDFSKEENVKLANEWFSEWRIDLVVSDCRPAGPDLDWLIDFK